MSDFPLEDCSGENKEIQFYMNRTIRVIEIPQQENATSSVDNAAFMENEENVNRQRAESMEHEDIDVMEVEEMSSCSSKTQTDSDQRIDSASDSAYSPMDEVKDSDIDQEMKDIEEEVVVDMGESNFDIETGEPIPGMSNQNRDTNKNKKASKKTSDKSKPSRKTRERVFLRR